VRAAEGLERAAERIALEATNARADAHDVGPRDACEALPLAGDELMASARRLRVLAAQERERARSVRSVRALDGPVALGPLRLDPATREVRVAGEAVRLAAKEYALLRVLISEPRPVFTKGELLRAVGGIEGQTGVRTRTLDSHASRLRRRLNGGPDRHFVQNVRGVGYRLTDEPPAADGS
jgi:DNA-binding response OmpR family regulator